jgi:hypothetical protein
MTEYDDSMVAALKRAVQDARDLIQAEVALAKAELRGEVRRVGVAVGAMVGAAIAAMVAVVFLLTAAAWGIAEGLEWPVWSGFTIVALAAALVAAVLAYVGRARLAREPSMPLTVETMKENVEWMRARTS